VDLMGGRWLNRHKDWIKKETIVEKTESVDDDNYGVQFIPLRCPQCQSKDVRCYVSRPPVRYHLCRGCGKKFKSVEVGGHI
jgi:transposase-like protein